MNDLNPKKSNLNPILIVALLAILIGLAAYAYVANKSSVADADVTPAAITAQTEAAPATDATQLSSETVKPVVVETKTLDLGDKTSDAAPTAESETYDPSIAAIMTPRFVGSPMAPVKITEYASLTCSHCAAFHRDSYEKFKQSFVDTNRVQLIFKEFPLNEPALEASQILRCMPEDKYVGFMNLLFTEQEKWAFADNYRDFLLQNAKLAGMSDETFDACLANKPLKEAILADMQKASAKYRVESTPSFVVNGGQRVLVGNQPFEEFEKAIAAAGGVATPAPSVGTNAVSSPATPATDQESPAAAAADAAADASVPEASTAPSPAE